MISHPIPGLPDTWRVDERTTSSGTRFFPKLNGRTLRTSGQGVAWFRTLREAEQAAVALVARMQS